MATIEQLEERIKKLEERILFQDKVIKRVLDFLQRALDTQFERKSANYKHPKEDQDRLKKESAGRVNKMMKDLGYKSDKKGGEPD